MPAQNDGDAEDGADDGDEDAHSGQRDHLDRTIVIAWIGAS
jgi:hypothetical protein